MLSETHNALRKDLAQDLYHGWIVKTMEEEVLPTSWSRFCNENHGKQDHCRGMYLPPSTAGEEILN